MHQGIALRSPAAARLKGNQGQTLQFRRAPRRIFQLVLPLARKAALGRRIGFQTGRIDRVAAIDARAVRVICDATHGRIDVADVFYLARDFREVHVSQQVGQ